MQTPVPAYPMEAPLKADSAQGNHREGLLQGVTQGFVVPPWTIRRDRAGTCQLGDEDFFAQDQPEAAARRLSDAQIESLTAAAANAPRPVGKQRTSRSRSNGAGRP